MGTSPAGAKQRTDEVRCRVAGCGECFKQTTARAARLCSKHRRAEAVLLEGEMRRFCSQCSRAHQLSLFSGGCRNCSARPGRKRRDNSFDRQQEFPDGKPHCRRSSEQSSMPGDYELPPEPQFQAKTYALGAILNKPPAWQEDIDWDRLGQTLPDDIPEINDVLCGVADYGGLSLHTSKRSDSGSLMDTISVSSSRPSGLGDLDAWWTQLASAGEAHEKFEQMLSIWSTRFNSASTEVPLHVKAAEIATHQRGWGFNVNMKIQGATPAHLPADMDSHIRRMSQNEAVGVMICVRTDCLQLSFDLWFNSREQAQRGQRAFTDALVSASAEMPWSQFDTTVLLGDECIEMHDGQISHRTAKRCPVSITSAAPDGLEPGALKLSVVTEGDAQQLDDYQLLLRMNGKFVDLDIYDVQASLEGSISVLARPTGVDTKELSGLAWIEFVSGAGMGDFVASNAAPVMLSTDLPEAAKELATYAQVSSSNISATDLKNIADVLHPLEDAPPDVAACAELMRWAATRGLHCTLKALIWAADEFCLLPKVLSEADKGGIGLLSLAAGSGSTGTVLLVCDWMEEECLEVDPCYLRGPMQMSTLHWAALQANGDVLAWLAEEFSGVHTALHCLEGGSGSLKMTPADICMASKYGLFPQGQARLSIRASSSRSSMHSCDSLTSRKEVPGTSNSQGSLVAGHWRRIPWLSLLFAPVALCFANTAVDACCAILLALASDGISQYSLRVRNQYIREVLVPQAVDAGIISVEKAAKDGMAELMEQFEMTRTKRYHSCCVLGMRFAGYWSLQFMVCLWGLQKCSEQDCQLLWLAWLAGTMLLSALLVLTSTWLETVAEQKYFNMAVLLTMEAFVLATMYTQPAAVPPLVPPQEQALSMFESLLTCAILGLMLGVLNYRAHGLAPLWTATACTVMDIYALAKDFQEVHYAKALPLTAFLLVGTVRLIVSHTGWIRTKRQLLRDFLRTQSKRVQ